MESKFKVGERVKVRLSRGEIKRGIVHGVTALKFNAQRLEYAVMLENNPRLMYYDECDLIKLSETVGNRCTCGAASVHAIPPGHAYYCDIERSKYFYDEDED